MIPSKLRDARNILCGVAGGVMLSVFYLRGITGAKDALDELRDGAALIVIVCLTLSAIEWWLGRRVVAS
jgi:hypothetical protein